MDDDAVVYHMGHAGVCLNDVEVMGENCLNTTNNEELDNVDASQALLIYLSGCLSYYHGGILCDHDDNRNPDVFLGNTKHDVNLKGDEFGGRKADDGRAEKVFWKLEKGGSIKEAIRHAAGENWNTYYAYCENNGANASTLTIKPARYS